MSIRSFWVCVVLPGCFFSDAVSIEPIFWSTRSDAVFICHYRGLERDGHSSWLLWRSCGKVNGKVQSCYRRNWERSAPFYARTSCLPEWVGNCCPPESLNSLCIQKSNNWVLSGKKEVLDLLAPAWLPWLYWIFSAVLGSVSSFSFLLCMWWKEVVMLHGSLNYPLDTAFI